MQLAEKLEKNKVMVRLFAFLLAVIPTSTTVSFAAFFGGWIFLAIGLVPSIVTMALSIIPTSIRAVTIMILGICSFLISSGIILFIIMTHFCQVEYYLPVPFEYFGARSCPA